MLGGLAAPSHKITPADINSARDTFEASETRDLFYRAATRACKVVGFVTLRRARHGCHSLPERQDIAA
jgi:hypothetical protein